MTTSNPYTPMQTSVDIASLNRDHQNRVFSKQDAEHGIDADTVERYADQIDDILKRSPIQVALFDNTYYLIDGHHRLDAYIKAYPDAETVPVVAQAVETFASVELHAMRANFQHGKHLDASERKHNVRRLAARLGYSGYSDKEFVEQLRGYTGIDKPTLNRYTAHERSLIERRLVRAVAAQRLSGVSIRGAAEALGITKRPVERVEEQRKKSIIGPLPDDVWTLAEVINLAHSIYVHPEDAYEWIDGESADQVREDGVEGQDWFYDSEYDDQVCIPFNREQVMREKLREFHEARMTEMTTEFPYLLGGFPVSSIEESLIPRIDELCGMKRKELEELLPCERNDKGLSLEQRKEFRCPVSGGFVYRYWYVRRGALVGADNHAFERSYIEKVRSAKQAKDTQEQQFKSDLEETPFEEHELEAVPVINPAEAFQKALSEHNAESQKTKQGQGALKAAKVSEALRILAQAWEENCESSFVELISDASAAGNVDLSVVRKIAELTS